MSQAAYRDYQRQFGRTNGKPAQNQSAARLLQPGTAVKNPAYPDTLYIGNLLGPHTVNTVPEALLQAFIDHGRTAGTLSRPQPAAQAVLDEPAAPGIDLEALALRLQQEGLKQFEQAFAQFLAILADQSIQRLPENTGLREPSPVFRQSTHLHPPDNRTPP